MTITASDFAYLQRLPRERAHVLPALQLVEEHEGWLSPEALTAVSLHLRVPNSELWGVARSYSDLRVQPPPAREVAVCTGLSCLLNGAREGLEGLRAAGVPDVVATACRFRCNEAPVVAVDGAYVRAVSVDAVQAALGGEPPSPTGRPLLAVSDVEARRVTARLGRVDPESLQSAREARSYEALSRARTMSAADVTTLVQASGLQGRGGAYFPAGRKWESARANPKPRYLVVNAEEGEPGVFKDRYLLEYDPHFVLEGALIAAHAIEATTVFFYVNGEARLAAGRLGLAIAAADAAGLLAGVKVELRRGAGGYVCGEESVILSSIEGERAVPRLRPPLPVDSGLWGRPTVINNVETLANLPSIVKDGPEAFRAIGTEAYPGTKVVCLSGGVRRPGLYEVPMGTPLRRVLYDLGGGPRDGRELRAVVCGGPSGGLLPASRFETPLLGGSLDPALEPGGTPGGAALGAGGIVAIDDSMSVLEVVHHLAAYNAAESCGKCTPCREGTPRMRDLLAATRDGAPAGDSIEQLEALDEAMSLASLCGLGQMAPLPYRSLRRHFGRELESRTDDSRRARLQPGN